MQTPISLHVPQDVVSGLESLSETTGQSLNVLAVRALQDFVERESWQLGEIKKALEEADAGDFANEAELAALDAKWGYHAH